MFYAICNVFGCPHVVLSATRTNPKLPIYISPVPDPMAWRQATSQHPWDDLLAYTFLALCSSSPGLVKSSAFNKALLGSHHFVLVSDRLVYQSSQPSGGQNSRAPLAVEPAYSASPWEVPSGPGILMSSCLEVTKCPVRKAGFSQGVADGIT